jgi:hypothetical protein
MQQGYGENDTNATGIWGKYNRHMGKMITGYRIITEY